MLSLFSISSSATLANIKISVFEVPGLHNVQQTGGYDKILSIIQKQGIVFDLNFQPIVRAKHNFHYSKSDCIVPTDGEASSYPFPFIQSNPLNYAKVFIFRRKGDGIIKHPENLKGLKVGIRKGMNYGSIFDNAREQFNLDVEPARNIELNYKKLMTGRIDAFIAHTPDVWNLLKPEDYNNLIYSATTALLTHSESVICHDTEKNRLFIKQFNRDLQELHQKGIVKDILGPSYMME